jgi:nucleotide-binding universal stress UspA family protein
VQKNPSSKPVVVGIDGSQEAIRAAKWAAQEAISRDVPLRLVYVINADPVAPGYSFRVPMGELALRVATKAVADQDKTLKVETVLTTGPVPQTLARESRHAEMLCLGAVGMGRLGGRLLGSTATALARTAKAPVAVVAKPAVRTSFDPIVVVIDPADDGDIMIAHALTNARNVA